jgi:hypothetical protein
VVDRAQRYDFTGRQLLCLKCENAPVSTSDADTAGTVEAAGHFRLYLGAAADVGKIYAIALSKPSRNQDARPARQDEKN